MADKDSEKRTDGSAIRKMAVTTVGLHFLPPLPREEYIVPVRDYLLKHGLVLLTEQRNRNPIRIHSLTNCFIECVKWIAGVPCNGYFCIDVDYQTQIPGCKVCIVKKDKCFTFFGLEDVNKEIEGVDAFIKWLSTNISYTTKLSYLECAKCTIEMYVSMAETPAAFNFYDKVNTENLSKELAKIASYMGSNKEHNPHTNLFKLGLGIPVAACRHFHKKKTWKFLHYTCLQMDLCFIWFRYLILKKYNIACMSQRRLLSFLAIQNVKNICRRLFQKIIVYICP